MFENIESYRKRTKLRLIELLGGKCRICGYDKTPTAMDFHHYDKKKKQFGISSWSCKSFKKLIEEIKKCVLVCCRCHREIEEGIIESPKPELFGDPDKIFRRILRENRNCLICKAEYNCTITSKRSFCSSSCRGKSQNRVDWPDKNELRKLVNDIGYRATGRKLGVSDNAVRKHMSRWPSG